MILRAFAQRKAPKDKESFGRLAFEVGRHWVRPYLQLLPILTADDFWAGVSTSVHGRTSHRRQPERE